MMTAADLEAQVDALFDPVAAFMVWARPLAAWAMGSAIWSAARVRLRVRE